MLTTFHFHDHAQPRGFRLTLVAVVICCAVAPARAAALGSGHGAGCSVVAPTGNTTPSQETFHTTGTIPEPTASTYFCARAQRASARVVQLPLSGGLAKTMTAGGVRGNATGPWACFSKFLHKTNDATRSAIGTRPDHACMPVGMVVTPAHTEARGEL